MIINIPDGIRRSYQEAIDSLMATNMLGRECVLHFPPLNMPATNLQTPLGNMATNTWAAGNPIHIHSEQPTTTYADGNNFISVEQTGIISMVVYWKPELFKDNYPKDERIGQASIRTRGFVSDLNKVLNCTYMETYRDLGTDHYKFKLSGEPVIPGKIIPSRYFFAFWEQI